LTATPSESSPASLTRRGLLTEGTWLAALLAAGRLPWPLRDCGASPDANVSGSVTASPVVDGGVCAGRSSASATARSVRPLLQAEKLARFVDPLPVPPVLSPSGTRPDPEDPSRYLPYYRIAMREVTQSVHRDLPPTRVWAYGGTMPGPILETRSGQGVLVEWANELPARHFLPIDRSLHGAHADQPEVRTVVHLHGARVAPQSDGYPEDWYPPGRSAISHYPSRQDATMLWYHDHAMGIERLNQYAGLFGAFFIRDDAEEALRLPSGKYEIPLVLCDRLFDDQGQLSYPVSGAPDAPWVSEVEGNMVLANGKLFPYLDVEAQHYRLRVVNASNSRKLVLSRSDAEPLYAIGTDQGLLPAPVEVSTLELAPAERADVIVDFRNAAGTNVVLRSQMFEVVQFRVAAAAVPKPKAMPSRLRRIAPLDPASAVKTRTLTLADRTDRATGRMLMLLDGRRWAAPVTERPELDTIEIWSFVNLTDDTHPIHLHAVRFQILDRQIFESELFLTRGEMRLRGSPFPPARSEAGWKDTVRAQPGTITRIIARFEGYAGRYVWHCHNLEHAANEMMRPFEIVAR
jgi:spore coat protein A